MWCNHQVGAACRLLSCDELAEFILRPRDLCSTTQSQGHTGRAVQGRPASAYASCWVYSGCLVRTAAGADLVLF